MKRFMDLIVLIITCLLIVSGYSYAQNKENKKVEQNIRADISKSAKADTNYDKSMAYFKYAEKNIITDKSKDGSYKGKFHNQNKTESTNSSLNSNSSNKNMVGSDGMMKDSTTQRMGKKLRMDATKKKTKKN